MKSNQELFFNHIKQIFLQNPHLIINYDTIYGELKVFNTENKFISRIDEHSLVDTQVNMFNKYNRNSNVNVYTIKNKYFCVIENRCGLKNRDYYNEIDNSIKLYIAVDPITINQVSSMLFDFIISENILSQSKISKEFRNDALIINVRKREDAEKIINFVNSLNYSSRFHPNPFIYNIGNVSMTLDGKLSYSLTLTKLLAKYFNEKKQNNELEMSTLDDFNIWVNSQIDILKSNNNDYLLNEYDIKDNEQLKDFIMVIEILSKNLEGNIKKEDIYKHQEKRLNRSNEEITTIDNNDFEYIRHVMNGLVNKYGIEESHKRIMYYINKRVDTDIFTRDKNIRNIVIRNFTPEKMKEILLELGHDALINAINKTINKYDIEQAKYAIRRLIEEKTIESFTNDNDARSYLGIIIPRELLEESIVDKTIKQKLYPSVDNMIYILLEEAESMNKSRGRN